MSNPFAEALRVIAADRPDAEALRDGHGALTYAELDGLAGTFARILVERCAPFAHERRPVPILLDRDRWSVAALLGAIRAGVPHVPLDRNLPTAALVAMLARLGSPDHLLVHPGTVAALPDGTVGVCPDLVVDDPIAPRPVVDADLACVVFTSGSTGRPKGVVLEWRNYSWLLDFLSWVSLRRRRILTVPLYWTGGVTAVVGITAGQRHSVLPAGLTDPVALLEWIDREECDSMSMPPTLLAQLAGRWPAGRRLEHVDEVHVFGDRLQWGIVPDVRRLCAPTAVIRSHYGSTEAAGIGICSMMIGPDDEVGTGPIPLGRWVEPGRGRLEPVDDADGLAEIVAVGKTARGFWDDPAEEAVRFGRDPDGTRIVRTGDLARIDEHGMIHLVGRADDLVKIRGIRVEPAEAEAALTAVPGIREAVALAHDGARGPRLVGHLVLDDDPTLTPESVRATLAGRLPPHLIPSPLVVHDALPLLPNRKVDRVALRSAPVTPWRTTPPRAPADDLEADVATLCAEVLELDHVGPDDDLWTLGLDSLGTLALAAEVSELGWGPFDPSAPLRHVTAAAIADWLRTTSADDDPYLPSEVIPLHPAPPGPGPTPIVALPGAGGTATAFFWLARALGPDRPVTVIEAHGLHTPGRPDRTIAAAASRAADLVDATHPTGPVVLLGHSAGGAIAHETAVLLHARGRDPHVVILDTILPAVLRARTPTAAPTSPAAATPSPATRPRPLRPWRRIPRRLLDETRVRLRAAHPGPPSRSLTRFRAFTRIGERALRDYQPTPAPVPVLCLHVDDRIRDAWTGAVPDLTCVAVPGDHRSLLRPPHVNAVADHLHALATTLDRAPHPDATC